MRTLRRGILALAILALGATVGLLLLWLTSVLASDRFHVTQRLSFVPRHFLVWPAVAGWVVFAVLSLSYSVLRPRAEGVPWRSERRGRSRVPRLLGKARIGLGVATLIAVLHLVVLEWRWPMNADSDAPPPDQRFRIVYWNVGWSHPDEVFTGVTARLPDLAIIANPLTRTDLTWDFGAIAASLGDNARVIRDWPITVVSKWPVIRWGVTELGFNARVSVDPDLRSHDDAPLDPGHAMFVELELPRPLWPDTSWSRSDDRPRSLVVWIIDLPSDPELVRRDVTRRARERIAMWIGPGGEGFPEPDVLIGDFNIPRGSASLMELRRRPGALLADAHAQAGLGPSPTWPDARPLIHIDQCFVAPRLRAAHYAIEDAGDTRHRMQVVDLVPN